MADNWGADNWGVTFSLKHDTDSVKATLIPERGLMDFMIATCITTKDRALDLFPIEDPSNWNEDDFPELTRQIFADTIGDLVSIWLWIWDR